MLNFTKKMEHYPFLILVEKILKNAPDNMKMVQIKNDVLICTDTKRLFQVKEFNNNIPPDFEITDGFYALAKSEGNYILLRLENGLCEKFPDTSKAEKPAENPEVKTFPAVYDENLFVYRTFVDLPIKPLINIRLLCDVIKLLGDNGYEVEFTTDRYPITIKNEKISYTVMPMSK